MSDYRWNAYDPATQWGLHFDKGLDAQLLKGPKLKDNGLSISWADQNGTERYFGSRRFESRVLTIPCTLLAVSEADFHTKYNALCDFLTVQGEFNFDVVPRNRRYKVSYLDMTGFDKLTMFKNNSNIGVKLTIMLADDHPAERFTIS